MKRTKIIEVEACQVPGCQGDAEKFGPVVMCPAHRSSYWMSETGKAFTREREELGRREAAAADEWARTQVEPCAECGSVQRYDDGSCFGCGPGEAPVLEMSGRNAVEA